ncbi:MAG: NAD(P)H-dependent oxidoreductase [Archangium sp.]
MLKLKVIVGSTREGRMADPVLKWLLPVVNAHGKFEVEVLDLRDWPLPMFQETQATVGNPMDPTYSQPLVKQWNAKIKEADAFLMITPEYNHSVPAVLKNAIDSTFLSFGFRHKAVGFVSYSGGIAGGVRAIEHLNQILLEAEAMPVRTQTLIPFVANAFDAASGKPTNAVIGLGFQILLDDLAWLAAPLKTARAAGQLPPPTFRLRAAMAAAAPKS